MNDALVKRRATVLISSYGDPKQQYLLNCLSEEAGEVVQAVSKLQRFGADDVYQGMSNRDKLRTELQDVLAVAQLLCNEGVIDGPSTLGINRKQKKVLHYLEQAIQEGRVIDV